MLTVPFLTLAGVLAAYLMAIAEDLFQAAHPKAAARAQGRRPG